MCCYVYNKKYTIRIWTVRRISACPFWRHSQASSCCCKRCLGWRMALHQTNQHFWEFPLTCWSVCRSRSALQYISTVFMCCYCSSVNLIRLSLYALKSGMCYAKGAFVLRQGHKIIIFADYLARPVPISSKWLYKFMHKLTLNIQISSCAYLSPLWWIIVHCGAVMVCLLHCHSIVIYFL